MNNLTPIVNLIVDNLRAEINKHSKEKNFDLLEELHYIIEEVQEEVISQLYSEIIASDSKFLEDPNVILHQVYPELSRSVLPKTTGPITLEDLSARSPYTDEQVLRIGNSCVGFAGFGGIQLAALLLARSGVQKFVFVDPDVFEASNANRQALCNSSTLGKTKVLVGREEILKINSGADVMAHVTKVTSANVAELFAPADILVVATGDVQSRNIVNAYARDAGKPVLNSGIAGWEAQYLTLMPEDPRYNEIFDFGIYAVDRGITPVVISIVDLFVAIDAFKIILGQAEKIVRYPKLLTVNLFRQNPIMMRDAIKIRARNKRRGI